MTAPIPPDALRHALFDPEVRKRRTRGYLWGYRIDADDLHKALAEYVPDQPPTRKRQPIAAARPYR